MTRKRFAMAALAAVVILTARPAAAQYGGDEDEGEGQRPFAITGGWMWTTGDTPRNSNLMLGIQFASPWYRTIMSQWVFSADWTLIKTQESPGVGATENSSFVPVLLNYKYHLFNGSPLYLMAGAGASWSERNIPEMGITNRIGFAWQGGVGYSYGAWFLEARYLAGPHPSRDALYGAQVGISF